MLAVLRFNHPDEARCQLNQLLATGLVHVELAVRADAAWVAMARDLRHAYPALRFGAASVCTAEALQAVVEAGLAYAVSPMLDPALLEQARAAAITLVPGVFTPTEVALAVRCGAAAVKLFPAAALGSGYWRSLAGPLAPLPFCIAAGGLGVRDVPHWLNAGVDAVALGGQLFERSADVDRAESPIDASMAGGVLRLDPDLETLLAEPFTPLTAPGDRQQLST